MTKCKGCGNEEPGMSLPLAGNGRWTREEWEKLKEAGDLAWDEYEKKFPRPPEGY